MLCLVCKQPVTEDEAVRLAILGARRLYCHPGACHTEALRRMIALYEFVMQDEGETEMPPDDPHDWIRQMAKDSVCPFSDPASPYEAGMVDKLTSFGIGVLRAAAETPKGEDDPTVAYIAELEADLSRMAEQKHALAVGMLLAVDTLRNPRYERVSQVIGACDALFATIYRGCGG